MHEINTPIVKVSNECSVYKLKYSSHTTYSATFLLKDCYAGFVVAIQKYLLGCQLGCSASI